MAKKLKAVVRLQIKAGQANPAPPIGPALATHGINLMQFCKEYNARTSSRMGEIIPAEISIFKLSACSNATLHIILLDSARSEFSYGFNLINLVKAVSNSNEMNLAESKMCSKMRLTEADCFW